MINKTHRFQGHSNLRFVYQRGQTTRGPQCSLKYALNQKRDTYRIAVVVSRKVHKSAVVRNRIRRRIYEVIRLQGEKIKQPFDLVFLVYSDQFATMPADQLNQVVVTELSKAGVV